MICLIKALDVRGFLLGIFCGEHDKLDAMKPKQKSIKKAMLQRYANIANYTYGRDDRI